MSYSRGSFPGLWLLQERNPKAHTTHLGSRDLGAKPGTDSNVPEPAPGCLPWHTQSSTPGEFYLHPRLPVSAALLGPAPGPARCCQRPPPPRGRAMPTEPVMTVPRPSGRVQPFPLDGGGLKEDDGHITGPFLNRPHHQNLPTEMVFPVKGSSLEERRVKSCLQALCLALPLRGVFLPLE